MTTTSALAVIALVTAVLTTACRREQVSPPPLVATNVLIVTIDTLRADAVGVYGATNVQTPNIDRLAREGAWAPQATVHAPLTRPTHVSLFTGLYPAEHGVRDNVAPTLGADVPLLADLFEREGFATGAFIASAVLERQSGLARGFAHYSDTFQGTTDQRRGDVVIADTLAWLKGKNRFFAWVHLYDPHAPYEPPGQYATTYADRPYLGEVAWSDELVGRLVEALRGAGTLDRTLVVVTSDHGEALGEHGEDVHGYFVYESTLRVPLVLRGPGVTPGTRFTGVARTVDLFPTIVETAGLAARPASSGRSLAPALRGGAVSDEPSFAESLVPLLHYGWSDLRAVRDGRWKYILAPRPELYDLDRDPGELRNLAESEPNRARAMRAGLEARLRLEQKAARTDTAAAGVPPELLERLGALGYVSPAGSPKTSTPGADPKDHLQEYKSLSTLMQHGLVALRTDRPAEAADDFRDLVRRGMDSYEVHYYLGRAYTALERWREAAVEYEKSIEKLPGDSSAWRGLGESRVALGDWPRAARAFEKRVSLAPGEALGHAQLGEVYRDMGRLSDAAVALRDAVRLDPDRAEYWNALGTVLGASGQMAEAETAFGEAATRDVNNALYIYNHSLALEQLKRRDEAMEQLRRAAALGYPPARELLERGRSPRRQ